MAFAGVNSLTVANVIMAHSATEKEAAMQSTRFVIAHSAAVETGVPKSLNPPAYVSSVTPIPPGVIARAVASTTSGMAAARCACGKSTKLYRSRIDVPLPAGSGKGNTYDVHLW